VPLTPDDIRQIVENTEVIRTPKQRLATFGTTVLQYFVVTRPAYSDLPGMEVEREAVVRSGKVTAQRPEIVTPFYLMNLFRGFEHGQDFARYLTSEYGPNAPGLMYRYEQEPNNTEVVTEQPESVAKRIAERLDREDVNMAAVIKGIDQFWDVSLAHFIHALTAGSAIGNAAEMAQRGMLQPERGLPAGARARIEGMFAAVARSELDANGFKEELDRWGVFGEYEDRFLGLFRR